MSERESKLTDELIETVLAGISDGIPLRQLARMHDFGKSIWYERVAGDADLAGRLARAREAGFDALAEETVEIADDGKNDWMERENGGPVVNGEHVSRSKLRIETRLKLLACWDPKRYGAKPVGDAENPLHVVNTIRREVIDPNAG